MSVFLVEKGTSGLSVSRTFEKLGYKGVETAELVFDDVRVPATHLLGGKEGEGFKHAMSGLEVGRINVAARAVGVAQAPLDEAMRIHVGYGYTKEFNVERYYCDAPFMLVAEGTSEIQKLVIARQLLEKYKL